MKKINDLSNFLNNVGFKETFKAKFADHPKVGSYYDVVYEKI